MKLIAKTIREAAKTPGFTSLYILGVALTIAFTMIYGIILYGQLAPIYPEYDRNNTLYLGGISIRKGAQNINSGYSQRFVTEYLRPHLKSADIIATLISYPTGMNVQTEAKGLHPASEFKVEVKMTDPEFFKLYRHAFVAGKPFTQADFDSKLKVAAISDKVAALIFDSPEEAIGKDIKINHVKHRISGIFREGSALGIDSYSEVVTPYYNDGEWSQYYSGREYELAGSLSIVMKVKPGQKARLVDELNDVCRRINANDTSAAKIYIPYVDTHFEHVLTDEKQEVEEDSFQVKEGPGRLALLKPLLIALLIVLVIPALNISGLIGSRMERMTSEIGIRRSFGATRRRLMAMVMTENLVLTFIGGILGLILAWIIIACAGDFLMQFTPLNYLRDPSYSKAASFITGEMAFAPLIFVAALIICLVLNTLSAWIPAQRALHRQITDSINTKR